MAETLRQFLDGELRWTMAEKGLQVQWNRLNQILASVTPASGVTLGTTDNDAFVVDDGSGGAAMIRPEATKSVTGPFTGTGAQATVTGQKVRPADPGGNIGPQPVRLSNTIPRNGFRPIA